MTLLQATGIPGGLFSNPFYFRDIRLLCPPARTSCHATQTAKSRIIAPTRYGACRPQIPKIAPANVGPIIRAKLAPDCATPRAAPWPDADARREIRLFRAGLQKPNPPASRAVANNSRLRLEERGISTKPIISAQIPTKITLSSPQALVAGPINPP